MWEVDPETKTKLLALQKLRGNTTCCDCSAPSPQWASPKFGTFICLTCAGLHRGLGVHISFVRSISMDAFKGNEISRMEKGGNERWKRFWSEKNGKGEAAGGWKNLRQELQAFEEVYAGIVGEEYKERLSCEVEGRAFTGIKEKAVVREKREAVEGMTGRSQKELNEEFFAKKGNENERRREDLPPSLGGKYAGFGSEPLGSSGREGGAGPAGGKGIPGVDEFQKDPVAALTKGFGWFTTTVGKGAKSVNDGWIQPNVQKLAEADLATQARITAAHVAQNIQAGSKTAAEQFNRFVEDSSSSPGSSSSQAHRGAKSKTAEPERKDFWDSFGAPVVDDSGGGGQHATVASSFAGSGASGRNSPAKQQQGRASPAPPSLAKGNAIGTAAMRKGGIKEKEEDKWEDF